MNKKETTFCFANFFLLMTSYIKNAQYDFILFKVHLFLSFLAFFDKFPYLLSSFISVGAGCSQLLSDMQAFKVKFYHVESLFNFSIHWMLIFSKNGV